MRALLPLALLALLPLAGASHDAGCTMGAERLVVELEAGPAGTFYVVPGFLDPFGEDDLFVYEESNGIAGLQRHDVWRDHTCGHPELADTVVL